MEMVLTSKSQLVSCHRGSLSGVTADREEVSS